MDVYISVFLFIVITCLLSRDKGDGKWPLGICIFAIYLMISFQAGWGGDWEAYNNLYDYYHGMTLSQVLMDDARWELGFKVAFSIMPSYNIMKFIFSAWYCLALFTLFYHFIPRRWWAFGFLCLFFNRPLLMGGLVAIARTGFAVAAFIIGLYYLTKEQKWKYVVILLIASLFHRSSLFFIPLVFIPTKAKKINPFLGIAVLFGILVVSVLMPSAWGDIVGYAIGGLDTFEEYSDYFDEGSKMSKISILIVFSFFWSYMLMTYVNKPGFTKNEYLVMFIGLAQIAFSLLPEIGLAARIYYYLNYAFFAGMIVLIDKEKNTALKWGMILSLVFVYGRRFMVFYNSPYFAEHWMIYTPFWNY